MVNSLELDPRLLRVLNKIRWLTLRCLRSLWPWLFIPRGEDCPQLPGALCSSWSLGSVRRPLHPPSQTPFLVSSFPPYCSFSLFFVSPIYSSPVPYFLDRDFCTNAHTWLGLGQREEGGKQTDSQDTRDSNGHHSTLDGQVVREYWTKFPEVVTVARDQQDNCTVCGLLGP